MYGEVQCIMSNGYMRTPLPITPSLTDGNKQNLMRCDTTLVSSLVFQSSKYFSFQYGMPSESKTKQSGCLHDSGQLVLVWLRGVHFVARVVSWFRMGAA